METKTVLAPDFKADPADSGWELLKFRWVRGEISGGWISDENDANAQSLSVERGYWQSPSFAITPQQYYKLTFQSKADLPGYWAAMFFDAEDKALQADHNSGLFVSDDWIDNEFYFQGKAEAVSAVLWFYPVSPQEGKRIHIRSLTLAEATDRQVLDWADRLYATMPAVDYEPPSDRWQHIPRSIQKLEQGQPLRIVILGDSIGNDTGNSPMDKLIERLYPGSKVTVITSIRGGTGCQFFQEENRVAEYVVRHEPDLVMIIHISHGHEHEPIRNVVRQIKEQCDAEIILTTGAVSLDYEMIRNFANQQKITFEEATEIRNSFLNHVEQIAADEQIELIPLRRIWNDHIEKASQQHDAMWFMRDVTHANVRGRQVLARILEKYFAPK